MDKIVIEGTVRAEDEEETFLHIEPPTRNSTTGYRAGDLLADYIGKRVRVTIEVLPDPDEDCPPATDADGRRPADKEPW